MKKKLILLFNKLMSMLSTKNIIVMEGINDFDSNTGAFFDFLIENNYNQKYKFIWLLKNKKNKKKIFNTKYYDINKINIFRRIKIARAKYLIYDNWVIKKFNDKQKSIYLSHGFPVLKNVKGIINIPKNCDHVLCTSEDFIDLEIEQFGVSANQIFINGMPRNDKLFIKNNEIKKLIHNEKYNKIIMWMPTFRKFAFSERNDSDAYFELGIPLISNIDEYKKINSILKSQNNLLIIKLHPAQDISSLKINDLSNIKVFTSDKFTSLDVDLYKLLNNIDALISDYSSVSFDYMLLDRPVAYNVDDIDSYKIGFAFENVYEYMPGMKIKNIADMENFLNDVTSNIDSYKAERNKVSKKANKYSDSDNCKRLADFLNL